MPLLVSASAMKCLVLEPLLAGSIISADVGVRKPDAGIYRILQQHSGYDASELLFIDDRAKNVQAALDLGIDSILFAAESGFSDLQRRLSSRLGR